MLNDLIIYVDFDSTLYDTPRFGRDLYQLIADRAHLPVATVIQDGKKFFADLRLGGYGYADHVRSYGLDAEAMWRSLDELVANDDYLYPDSPGFIQSLCDEGYKPHILSFGEQRFQTVKIVSALQHLLGATDHQLGFDVVMRKKREHIIEKHPGMHGVLVDDKPDQDLPEGFIEITLDRSAELEQPRRNGSIYVASNLIQAAEIIRSLGQD